MASPPTRLASRRSGFNSSVVLYELPTTGTRRPRDPSPPLEDSPSSSRRSKRLKVEEDNIEDLEIPLSEPSTSTASPKKKKGTSTRSPSKPKPIQMSLSTPHAAPPNWRQTYDAIKVMRSQSVAPVDTMGCHQSQRHEVEPKNRRLSTLISLMLSSQTKDEVTDAAVINLRQSIGGTISIDALIQADEATISEAINKVGFWRRKTQYIKQAAVKLRDEFDSDVPKTVDELCSLPGIGPKMAFLTLQVAWNINAGIGVDVHVHRITNKLGWHKPPTTTPEQTRLNLQSWLPKELHEDINTMLVGFGQMICTSVKPKCGECSLSSLELCPSAFKGVKRPKTDNTTAKLEPEEVQSPGGPALEVEIEMKETEEC
ncbi:DNA glycosylase, partial [Flagelloscypha sp. PMI_526]